MTTFGFFSVTTCFSFVILLLRPLQIQFVSLKVNEMSVTINV